MNLTTLARFLVNANKAGYGTGDYSKWVKEKNGSTSIRYREDDWEMHDNFFGGEPFGGRLVVSIKEKPIWMFVYYGYLLDNNTLPVETVYKFLQEALVRSPQNFPIRGPGTYENHRLSYKNVWNGEIDRFLGEEKIFKDGSEIYKANYLGGWVDLQSG